MLIIGAGGHAKEVFGVLSDKGSSQFVFYDDIPAHTEDKFFQKFDIIKTEDEVSSYFKKIDKRFVLGLGGTDFRRRLAKKMMLLGGELNSVVSKDSLVSKNDVLLGEGINIMHKVIIQPSVKIGKGSLINAGVMIHHDTKIGEYCEIGPGVIITGRSHIGNNTFVGCGAIIMPGLTIGENVIIGAGAVVTKSVNDNTKIAGIPARPIN